VLKNTARTVANKFSEGQFDIVIREEKAQILDAFDKLSTAERGPEPYRPVFSIVICGKRHHARYSFIHILFVQSLTHRFRFYPTSSNFADKNGNTRPGTVVDKGIVFHPDAICSKFNSIKA
jgi:hypothetical protein